MGMSVLHIRSEVECRVYLFDEEKGVATSEKYLNLDVRRGKQCLHFVSLDNKRCYDETYFVENEDSDYIIELDEFDFETDICNESATKLEIEDGIEDKYGVVYSSDGSQLLFCKNTDLLSYTIKSGCKIIRRGSFIPHDVFSPRARLKWINIPNTVTSIGEYAFAHCKELASIFIPSSVVYIGERPFSFDENLVSITVDDSNPKYDSRNNCNAIIESNTNTLHTGCKNTIIPNTTEHIGDKAFERCHGLQTINIPDSVITIGKRAFAECGAVRFDDVKYMGWDLGITSIRVPDSVTRIGDEAFLNCDCLKDVILSGSLISIGERSFEGCGFNSVILPDSISTIGNEAFADCRGLKAITIPGSVSIMGDGVFEDCYNLSSIVFQGEIHYLGQSCFRQCTSLRKIVIPMGTIKNYERLIPPELHDKLIEVCDG